MERRAFLKNSLGIAAGLAVLATSAHAAPQTRPIDPLAGPPNGKPEPEAAAQPAVATPDDIDKAQVEQVRWGWRRRWRRRRFWGYRRRRFWRRRRFRRYYY